MPNAQDETRTRLLDAAAELFATQGIRATTVRDICDKAGTNGAAVNYHFAGKDKLYLEALEHARQRALREDPYPAGPPPAGPLPPEDRLHRHIRGMLARCFATGPAAWYANMILREMVEPTHALAHAMQGNIAPHQRKLEGIVAELLDTDPRNADDPRPRDLAYAIIAMVLHYHHGRPAVSYMHPDMSFDQEQAERLTEVIHRFALAGIAAFRP
ncbi:MAG: CerR family C-terminal domain-containing protein [Phycisphaerales bacterium JB063]